MPDGALDRDWSEILAHASALFGEGIVIHGPDGATIEAANDLAPGILGLTPDQLYGRSNMDPRWRTVDADGQPLPGERHPSWVAYQTGEPQRDVLLGVHRPDGELRWLSVTAVPIADDDDGLRGILVRFADVTAQQASLRALELGARRMSEVERIARLGNWEWEPHTERISWSDGMYALMGMTRDGEGPSVDAVLERLILPDELPAMDETFAQAFATGEEFNIVARMRRADGEVRIFRIRGRPRVDEEGTITGVMGTAQDITAPAELERELSRARDQLRGVLDAVTEHAIVATDPQGVITDVNHGAELILGYTADEIVGRSPEIWHDPDEIVARAQELGLPPSLAVFTYAARKGRPETREWTFVRKDRARRRMALTTTMQRDEDGAVVGYISVCRDVTEPHRAELARQRAEARFRTAFDHAPIGVALVGLHGEARGRLLDANRALALLLGRDEDELDGMRLDTVIHPEDWPALGEELCALAGHDIPRFQSEVRLMHRDGQFVWALLGAAADLAHDDDDEVAAVLQVLDITERKRFEGQLQYLADHDPLTGLFNRRRFEEELERTLAHAERYRVPGALMVVDLDGLKAVNDTLGHAVGDELIERVARLLRHSLRTSDVVARLGGDEFGILLPQLDRQSAEQVAGKLLEELRDGGVVLTANRHGKVTASIGIAAWAATETPAPHELFIQADLAMYAAKAAGRDRYAVHDPALHAGSQPFGAAWLDRLRDALDVDDGFVLHAQPIIPLDDDAPDKIERYELLVRMCADDGSLIPPGTFLGLAERYDLVQQLDRWVLARAVELVRAREAAKRPVNVTVNLSGRTVNDATIARDLELLLRNDPIREGALTVEVTETEAIVNIDRARVLARDLRALGCRFALDDFGAGFASFYYLKHLAFDLLKIDGEFIRQLPITPTDRLVVRAVVDIAKAMGTQTCAEFVGDDETVQMLRDLGVDYGQGFHLGRPRPVDDLLREARAGSAD